MKLNVSVQGEGAVYEHMEGEFGGPDSRLIFLHREFC